MSYRALCISTILEVIDKSYNSTFYYPMCLQFLDFMPSPYKLIFKCVSINYISLFMSTYRKVGLFRKCRVNMQRPISAKRNAWEGNFTSIGVLNLGN